MQNQTSIRRVLSKSMINKAYLLLKNIQNVFLHSNQTFQLIKNKKTDIHSELQSHWQLTLSLNSLIDCHLSQKLLMLTVCCCLLVSSTLILLSHHWILTELIDPFNERFRDLKKSVKSCQEESVHTAQEIHIMYNQTGFASVCISFTLLDQLILALQCVCTVLIWRIEKISGALNTERVFETEQKISTALNHWHDRGLQMC